MPTGKKIVLSDNATEVATARYFNNGEDWESCTARVAKAVSDVEFNKKDFSDKFHEVIYNMDFIPGGRILRNAGRVKGSMLNCYVVPIGDSIEEIGQFIKDSLTLWSEGGGVGCNFSNLRPAGDPILGKGGHSSGMVSFIKAADAVSKTIESGGQRRAAALACVEVSHPEVVEFINSKLVDNELSHFNISVLVNEEFLKAVEANANWTFKFKQREYQTVPAREIWNLIVSNMINKAEPGLLNGTNLYKNNSYYFDPVVSTNPCWTGDTLVAVADGRGEVSFEQLAMESKDVPVYCFNPKTKETEIRMMRNPRKTSEKEKILEIILDDGSSFKCTENHKLVDKNGIEVFTKDLKPGSRLHHMIKTYGNNIKEQQEPIAIWNGYVNKKGYCFEHRVQAEFLLGRKLKDGESVHHRDENNQNNTFENICVMNHGEHTKMHQSGDKNVMRSKWWNNQSEKIKNEYKRKMSISTSGTKNGNWSGYTLDDLKPIALTYIISLGRKPLVKEWVKYCKDNKLPHSISATSDFINEVYESINLNYKVVSIRECDYEAVYNGTVDDFHNYYVFTNFSKNKSGKNRKNYILSKNCGEAVLENYGSCCLGSLVLPNFITGTTNTNWQKLERTIKLAVRFLDNVIDVNKYTLNEIDIKGHNGRRIGLGIMGLADYLFAKELRYGSKEALAEIERLMKFIRDIAYQTSVELAVEKGAFPRFDPVYYGNSSFVRKLPAPLRMEIKSKGIRNVTLLSIAPTGTISLLRECSSGIEPLMFKSYKRRDRVGERVYIHPRYKNLLLTGNAVPSWFVDMTDLSPKDHFETQAMIQKYVDGAVSKTINLPAGTTADDLDKLLLEYTHDLKGVTVYVDGSRGGQVYENLTEEEAIEYIAGESVNDELSIDDVECACAKPVEDEEGKEIGCEIPTKIKEE